MKLNGVKKSVNLVTGATGHIGNVLVRSLLEKGEKVRALIWRGEDLTPIKDLPIERVEGDVLDAESLDEAAQGADKVFHLAGMISIMPGQNEVVHRVNVEGTRNMLHAARKNGVRRFIYTSSIHAITRVPHGTEIDENLPFDPHNPVGAYDRSKAEASLHVQEAARQGLDAVIVCPTGVIGPYDYRGSEMGQVILDAMSNKPQFYVDGAYDFVDVRDVAQGLMLAGEKGRRGESYILSGERISVFNLLDTVRQVTGLRFPSIKIPFDLAKFFAHFTPIYYRLTHTKPRFTPYSLATLQSNSHISNAKARAELGYSPRSLKDSLADTVRWFLENRKLNSTAQGL